MGANFNCRLTTEEKPQRTQLYLDEEKEQALEVLFSERVVSIYTVY